MILVFDIKALGNVVSEGFAYPNFPQKRSDIEFNSDFV